MSNYILGFQNLGVDLNNVRNGATTCPWCSSGRRKSKDRCLSVNLESGNYNCNHCGEAGRADSKEWLESQQKDNFSLVSKKIVRQSPPPTLASFTQPEKKEYSRPTQQLDELDEKNIAWFKSRGISKHVLDRNKLKQNSKGDVAFVAYDGDEMVSCKFRKTSEKAFYQVPNCRPTLFKLNDIKEIPLVIISEGEMDALSWEEAGLKCAVSIDKGAPNVGSNVGAKLDCLKECAEFLGKKTDVYIAVDNDPNGKYLEQILVDRFGRHRCYVVKYPQGCKDANDVLMKFGVEGLAECYNSARKLPIEDVQKAEDVWDEILEDFDNGVAYGEFCGFDEMRRCFSWIKGFMYLWHGIPNHGKSAFVTFLMILKSIKDGTKWAVFSPEHSPAKNFYKGIIKAYTGKDFNKDSPNALTKADLVKCKPFINEHFIFIYPKEQKVESSEDALQNPKWILDKVGELALTEGIGGFLIDPWNQLDHVSKDMQREDQYLGHWFKQFKKLSQVHNLYCNIVAHPAKMYPDKEGVVRKPTAYDLSGGAMWGNKFDVITCIHRPFFYTDKFNTSVEIDIQKAKEQYRFGRPDCITVDFDVKTGWYSGQSSPSPMADFMGGDNSPKDNSIEKSYRDSVNLNSIPASVKRNDDDVPF